MKKPGFLDDAKHFVGWGKFCEPQQHPLEFVGVRSSPATYMKQNTINSKSKPSGVLRLGF
jgi:hypothetical protein